MTNTLRAFIAIELPPPVLLATGDAQKKLKAAGLRLKWVRPENLHLTLRFLGDIAQSRIPEIVAAIRSASKEVIPFALNAGGIGVFPNFRAPRVIWMGIDGDLDTLGGICQRLEEKLTPLGFPPEGRPFTGHLTLGRVAERINIPLLQNAVSAADPIESGIFTVDRICFIKSDLRPTGAIYTRLAEIILSDNQEPAVKPIYRDFHQEES
ncbi:MAG: RNA 2',3'-cyclic phosphodiesterase [Pseudomonadota bacterium]